MGAAGLLEPGRRHVARDRGIKRRGDRQSAFHWTKEGVEKRHAMIDLLGELDVGVFATVHSPVAPKRQENARARSMRQLVTMLNREGVDELIIESRGIQDVHDRQVLIEAAQAGLCSPELTYSFGTKTEALLWLPDAVAGLLSEAECGRSDRWIADLQRVAHVFEVRRIDL